MVMILMLAFACSDNGSDQDPDPQDCKVTSYRCQSRNESWRIVYTESGSIDSILVGNYDMTEWNEIRDFSYALEQGESVITVKNHYEGGPGMTNKVEHDGLGKVFSIRDISDVDGSWDQVDFVYATDPPHLLDRAALSFIGSDDIFVSYYQWDVASPVGFNMTKHATDGGTYDFAYYFETPTQAGDFLNFEKLINMYNTYYMPFSSTNLLKAIYFDDELQSEITYTFDSDNRITSFTVEWPGDEFEEWELAYDCE